ncbi:MAG TPA: hypothetical protein VK807_23060, partial [Gemmatimonadaceae bacterium]|nr:hypothetical protein [Gemmatimonadaceae bacterium]
MASFVGVCAWTSRAGAQPPPPTCGPSCPTPVIVFSPAGGTDTLLSQSETIDICGAGGGDSAAFNGTPITSQFTWNTSSCSGSVPNGVQNGQNGNTYTVVVGTNTFYVHACNNAVPKVCTSGSATFTHPALGVNPKLKTVNVTQRSAVTQKFTVSNYTRSSQTYALTVTCTPTVTNCGISGYASDTVSSESRDTVTVAYTSGAANTSGTVQLKAVDPAGHADSATMTVNAINALTVSTAFMNQDDQDMSRCAVSCFAATTAVSTVPIISKGMPQGISLVYHGDRVAVRPFLYMDVTAGPSTPSITDLQLTAQYQVNGSWIAMTFVNTDHTVHFTGSKLNAKADTAFRLGAQVDMSSVANTAWAAAPLKITLVAVYSDHQEFYTDSSQTLSVVSERASPIAAGWSVAGVPHLYGRSDNTASQIVVKEGNGSTTMYNGNNCSPNCIWMPTGAGVFS